LCGIIAKCGGVNNSPASILESLTDPPSGLDLAASMLETGATSHQLRIDPFVWAGSVLIACPIRPESERKRISGADSL